MVTTASAYSSRDRWGSSDSMAVVPSDLQHEGLNGTVALADGRARADQAR